MSTASAVHGDHGPAGHDDHAEHIHPPIFYIKIWGILLVLLAISIAGPMLEIRPLTLITAFGIAVVKAYIVCAHFMHLNIEKKYVLYFLATAIAFMALFFFAIAPDTLNHHGTNWTNVGAIAEIERHGGKDEGPDLHEPHHEAEHGGAEPKPDALEAYRTASEKKLAGVEAAMKSVGTELAQPKAPVVPDAVAPEAPPAPPKEEAPIK